MINQKAADERYMRRALALAARGAGRVEPNPMVGCVIVRGGRVLGEGYHRRFGGPHAEIEALRRCSRGARGATLYVTLEPCCHHGKTPPCTDALLAAGVARVVAARRDPNPQVSGRGLAQLRRAGVPTEVGLLAAEATDLIAPFTKLVSTGRPWVILKWAQSLDGKIATRTGDAKWISDALCRRHAHEIRGRLDAIVVGRDTVRRDDPALTCRVGRPRRVATRVVLDRYLRTRPSAQVVRTAGTIPTWIFCGKDAAAIRRRRLEQAGVVIHPVRATRTGLALPAVLDVLGRNQMTNVLIEGGGALLGAFHDAGLADEYHIYLAPLLIGGREAIGPLDQRGPARVRDALHIPPSAEVQPLGDGVFVRFRCNQPRRTTAN